jgi:hypothetical protein
MTQPWLVSTQYFGNRAETFSRVGGEGVGLAGGENNGFRFLVRKKMEMMADDDDQLKKANLKDLGIAAVMFQERALQALEGNKVIVEHRGNKPSLEDAMKAIEEARRIVNADVIDVTEVSE